MHMQSRARPYHGLDAGVVRVGHTTNPSHLTTPLPELLPHDLCLTSGTQGGHLVHLQWQLSRAFAGWGTCLPGMLP
jgi:hypothetical protein